MAPPATMAPEAKRGGGQAPFFGGGEAAIGKGFAPIELFTLIQRGQKGAPESEQLLHNENGEGDKGRLPFSSSPSLYGMMVL